MQDVNWDALRDQYRGYDTGVAELRAASARFRQDTVSLDDDAVRAALADLFAGLADDAETTGPDPRALAVARCLASLAPAPALRQLEPRRPVPGPRGSVGHRRNEQESQAEVLPAVPSLATAVAGGRPATRADLVIARAAVAVASVWHRFRHR